MLAVKVLPEAIERPVTVAALPETLPVIVLVAAKSVKNPLVTLAPVKPSEPTPVILFAANVRAPPEMANPPVALATVMSAVPLKLTPPIVLEFCKEVAVVALPDRAPEKVVVDSVAVEGLKVILVDETFCGRLPVLAVTQVGYIVALVVVSSVMPVLVALVADVAELAEPSILTPVKLRAPLPRFRATPVVPM